MKVLIVDDEELIRTLLENFVSDCGHEVTSAENGERGWDLFSQAEEPFDLVLADAKMPVMEGPELLRNIREGGHATPFILMTGHTEEEMDLLIDQGADGILRKPFPLNAIKDLIKEFLPRNSNKK